MISGDYPETENGHPGPPRVVILGGGYGGIYTALGLKKAARRKQIKLSLVSRDNFFLYQPMLAEVVSGSIEPQHIVNPIRRLLPFANFHQADVEAVDSESRNVIIRYPGRHTNYERIPYDHLVIAVGSSMQPRCSDSVCQDSRRGFYTELIICITFLDSTES